MQDACILEAHPLHGWMNLLLRPGQTMARYMIGCLWLRRANYESATSAKLPPPAPQPDAGEIYDWVRMAAQSQLRERDICKVAFRYDESRQAS